MSLPSPTNQNHSHHHSHHHHQQQQQQANGKLPSDMVLTTTTTAAAPLQQQTEAVPAETSTAVNAADVIVSQVHATSQTTTMVGAQDVIANSSLSSSSNHQQAATSLGLNTRHLQPEQTQQQQQQQQQQPQQAASSSSPSFANPTLSATSVVGLSPVILSSLMSRQVDWKDSYSDVHLAADDYFIELSRDKMKRLYGANQDTRTHVVGELYDTERSYVESLQILVEKYMIPLKSVDSNRILIDSNLVDEIFYTIPEILKHHETFLSALQDRLSSDWDTSQVIGNVFIEAFTNQQIIDTYTAFINNWKNARQAIKVATQAKPAFEKFLEAMSREHRNKLTLDALLIMPVQRIPRYELLIKELIKHTPEDHPDYGPLIEAQKQIHELALKIDQAEKEMIHQEQLKDLEALIEGHVELQHPQRDFIRYDLVTILGASSLTVAKKERVLFLFCDLLIMTSVKKKASRRSNLQTAFANSSNDLSLLEGNKFKLLLRVPLDQVEIRLSSDQIQIQREHQEQQHQLQLQQQNKLIQERKKEAESDLYILHQIETLTSKMIIDDKAKINDTINELSGQLRQKLFALEQSEPKAFGPGLHYHHHQHHHQANTHATLDTYSQSTSASGSVQSSSTMPLQTNFINNPASSSTSAYNVLSPTNFAGATTTTAPAASSATTTNTSSTLNPSSSPSFSQQQESNTSLEFLISSTATSLGGKEANLGCSSTTSESISGEQGYVVGGCETQLQANCEILNVTFASIDRRQAFLMAFIEAKQQRYHLQQQRIQFPRMYSSSVTLKLSQSPDRRSMSHDSRKAQSMATTSLKYQQQQADELASSSLSPMQVTNRISPKCQQQKPPISGGARISSAPLVHNQHHHQYHHQSAYNAAPTIVHQMSAPQSLTLAAASLADSADLSLSQCTLCSTTMTIDTAEPNQQHHHHHHQLMHQPHSQPASLDTICCHEQHNTLTSDSGGSLVNPANRSLTGQMNEPGVIDRDDQYHSHHHHQHRHHHHHQRELDHYLQRPAISKSDETETSDNSVSDLQKAQLMMRMSQLLLFKFAPKFLLTIPMNFLNTQHPALKFTCSALRNDVRITNLYDQKRQTFLDNTGQLWVSLSNGYVSHVALISIRRRALKKSFEGGKDLEECIDSSCESRQCFTLVPIIQAAGDICKSQINCAAQVRWRNRRRSKESYVVVSDDISDKMGGPKDTNNEGRMQETIEEVASNSVSPPVDIRPTSATSTAATTATDSSRKIFLSESAPSKTYSEKLDTTQIATTSASTTRLEVPCFGVEERLNQASKSLRYKCHNHAQGEDSQSSTAQRYAHHRLSARSSGCHLRPCNERYGACEGHHQQSHHYHHHHHPHHHHHSHHHHYHHNHQPRANHPGHHHHHHHHQPHNVYNGRHNTVPLGELRRALERQSRITDLRPNLDHCRNNQQQQQQHLAPPTNTPSEAASSSSTLANYQRVNSLDLADRSGGGTTGSRKGVINRATTPPAGMDSESGPSKSFRSARLLRHQASLKTSSILAKLVGGASKRSSYLRRSKPEVSAENKHQLDVDDNDNDAENNNSQQTSSKKNLSDTLSVDSSILALTTPGANKCLLAAMNRDENNAVVSPLSSASSLISTNSSMTVNSVCASSPNRSTCDLLGHSSSTTCCKGLACSQQDRACNRGRESGLRSRSATVPTRSLYQQYLDMERNRCLVEGCQHREHQRFEEVGANEDRGLLKKTDSYKVSEIVGEVNYDRGTSGDHESRDIETSESSLWLGCDDGSLIIIHCLMNHNNESDTSCCDIGPGACNNKHSEVKMSAAICDISPFKDELVFVALSNGQLAIFKRLERIRDEGEQQAEMDNNSNWSLTNPRILTLANYELNFSSKLCLIGEEYIWYSYGKNIFVLNIATLKLESTIMVPTHDPSLQFSMQPINIENMEPMSDQMGVWISFKNSHLIQLYDVKKYKLLTEIDLFKPINNMLSYGNEILRQHKTNCLKATALLNVNNNRDKCNTLFVGTSAGIVLYLSISHEQLSLKEPAIVDNSLSELKPQVASLHHGHSGHVKFLHLIEAEDCPETCLGEVDGNNNNKQIYGNRDVFLISGGQGIDRYGPIEEPTHGMGHQQHQFSETDDDNLNHLMLWQL